MTKFQVGDRVRWHCNALRVGTVMKPPDWGIWVEWEREGPRWENADNLILVAPAPKAEKAEPRFKPGDRVTWESGERHFAGTVVRVPSIFSEECIDIESDGRVPWSVAATSLQPEPRPDVVQVTAAHDVERGQIVNLVATRDLVDPRVKALDALKKLGSGWERAVAEYRAFAERMFDRYPHTCPVCGGPCSSASHALGGLLRPEHAEHPPDVTCPPVLPEPEVCAWGLLSNDYPSVYNALGCRHSETIWKATGSGVEVRHPIREQAIALWRAAVAR